MIRLRLADVPLDVRMKAAQKVCKRERSADARAEVTAAALMPRETHWLPDVVRPLLDEWAREQAA